MNDSSDHTGKQEKLSLSGMPVTLTIVRQRFYTVPWVKVFVKSKPLDAPAASALFILRTSSWGYTSATRKKSGQVISS